MPQKFNSLHEFWPFYMSQHEHRATRVFHFIGTVGATSTFFVALLSESYVWLWAVPFFGYGPAWISHAFVEKNKPATFTNPIYSFLCDFKMCAEIIKNFDFRFDRRRPKDNAL